ncbi:NAD(P)-binding protein [Corynespora cassiicola Philippines]|uniref:NAD(P)-binding protein n=1 Tax=Corynespora cassiicola Philippines TaxID=1448308 RepID=A0A2T2NNU1_CORCC|nr:NAD(P)-binding protein [Corynespora cassiicola Philippines]
MPSIIKNVALAGASGTLGSTILNDLVQDGNFNVTVLVRKQVQTLPASVSAKLVNTDSAESIIDALRGQDAFIDATFAPEDPNLTTRLIDAAAAAGVYRILPGEYTLDPQIAEARHPLVYHGKNQAYERAKKLAADGKTTYTTISNSAFLDWNLRTGFININLHDKKVQYMNDGTFPFPWTHVSSVSKAVVNALRKPEQTENRSFYISNVVKSQRQMVDLVKEVVGTEGWEETTLDMDQVLKKAIAELEAGKVNFQNFGDVVRWSISTVHSPRWEQQDDNRLLGVKEMTDDEIRRVVLDIYKEGK